MRTGFPRRRAESKISPRSSGALNVGIVSPGEFSRGAAETRGATPAQRALLAELALYVPYLSDHPVFDDRNARRALGGTSVRNVPVVDYVDRVVDYVRATLSDPAER